MDNLNEDVVTFMTRCRSILPRMRNVLDKNCKGNLNTYFMFNIFF